MAGTDAPGRSDSDADRGGWRDDADAPDAASLPPRFDVWGRPPGQPAPGQSAQVPAASEPQWNAFGPPSGSSAAADQPRSPAGQPWSASDPSRDHPAPQSSWTDKAGQADQAPWTNHADQSSSWTVHADQSWTEQADQAAWTDQADQAAWTGQADQSSWTVHADQPWTEQADQAAWTDQADQAAWTGQADQSWTEQADQAAWTDQADQSWTDHAGQAPWTGQADQSSWTDHADRPVWGQPGEGSGSAPNGSPQSPPAWADLAAQPPASGHDGEASWGEAAPAWGEAPAEHEHAWPAQGGASWAQQAGGPAWGEEPQEQAWTDPPAQSGWAPEAADPWAEQSAQPSWTYQQPWSNQPEESWTPSGGESWPEDQPADDSGGQPPEYAWTPQPADPWAQQPAQQPWSYLPQEEPAEGYSPSSPVSFAADPVSPVGLGAASPVPPLAPPPALGLGAPASAPPHQGGAGGPRYGETGSHARVDDWGAPMSPAGARPLSPAGAGSVSPAGAMRRDATGQSSTVPQAPTWPPHPYQPEPASRPERSNRPSAYAQPPAHGPKRTGLKVFGVVLTLLLVGAIGFVLKDRDRLLGNERPQGGATPGDSFEAGPPPVDPFDGTPAARYAQGEAGITLPAATEVPGFTAAQVTTALQRIRSALVAARLDSAMLVSHDPAGLYKLLSPRAATDLQPYFEKRDFFGFATQIAPGHSLTDDKIRVSGSLTFQGTTENGVRLLKVVTNFVWVYPFTGPLKESGDHLVIVHDQVSWDLPVESDVDKEYQGLRISSWSGYASNMDCALFKQSQLGLGEPQVVKSGAQVDADSAFDPHRTLDIPNTC